MFWNIQNTIDILKLSFFIGSNNPRAELDARRQEISMSAEVLYRFLHILEPNLWIFDQEQALFIVVLK